MFFVKTSTFLGILWVFCLKHWRFFQFEKKNSYQADAVAISKYSLLLHQQKTVLLIATA